jgi:hypothetical protein
LITWSLTQRPILPASYTTIRMSHRSLPLHLSRLV